MARRARLNAGVIAVTGSVGKTGTKEMLKLALGRQGETMAPVGSYNNHWGVPLTLVRTPTSVRYAVYEIGMSNPGEIVPLAMMARPDVAIVTTVQPVHLASFPSVDAIADEKASIYDGLPPHGVAVGNADIPTRPACAPTPWRGRPAASSPSAKARGLTCASSPARCTPISPPSRPTCSASASPTRSRAPASMS